MEPRNERKTLIARSIRPIAAIQMAIIPHRDHSDHISMAEHDTLRLSSSAAGVDQEAQIFTRIDLIWSSWPFLYTTVSIPFQRLIMRSRRLRRLRTHKNNPIFRDTGLFRCLSRDLQEWLLRNQSLRSGILQLICQLVGCIGWICRRNDSTSPRSSEDDRGIIYVVWRIYEKNVAFLPFPGLSECVSKAYCCSSQSGVCV